MIDIGLGVKEIQRVQNEHLLEVSAKLKAARNPVDHAHLIYMVEAIMWDLKKFNKEWKRMVKGTK